MSVVIPAYNEASTLEHVVRRVDRVLASAGHMSEIIIVNDASRDETGAIADRLRKDLPRVMAIHHAQNGGYGAAQRTGLKAASAPLVCVLPADGQVPPEELPKFLAASERADVIVGAYRARPDALRRLFSWVYGRVLRMLFGVRLRNVNAPKLFRREQLATIEITARGGFADAQMVIQMHRQGRRFHEIEIECVPRAAGRSSIGMGAAFEAILELWAFYRSNSRR